MSDLTVAVYFTQNNGDDPATGLALADIDLYLTSQNKATGALAVIWDGTQNPAAEVTNVGGYIRIYTGADIDTYHYHARGTYTGATALDQDTVTGATECCDKPIGTSLEYTYTVTNSVTGLPIEGVDIWISTDLAGTNVIWAGNTDAFGVARDDYGNLPRLDPGTYYFWKQEVGFVDDDNPDTETVS